MIPDRASGSSSRVDNRSRLRRALPLLLLLSLAPAFPAVFHVLVEGVHVARLPWATSRPEAFILDGVSRVATGRPLYSDIHALPFVVHVYNPAVYLTVGIAARILKLGWSGMLFLGRGLSYACAVLLAALLGLIVKRETGSRLGAALIAVAFFYFYPPLPSGFYRLRPEMPAALATFGAVAILLSSHRLRIPAAAALFFVAFSFKQPFVSAPIAAFLFLFTSGARRDALELAGWLGTLIVLFFGAMTLWSGGHYWENAILSMAWDEVHPLGNLRAEWPALRNRLVGLFVAALPALFVLARSRRHRLLVWYLGVSAAVTFYTAGKFGSDLNYYAELGTILLLVATLGAYLARGPLRWCILLPLVAFVWIDVVDGRSWHRRFDGVESVDLDSYVDLFRDLKGPLLCTNERLAIRLGDPEVFDWVLMRHLAERGHYDKSLLFDRIANGYYAHVIVDRKITSRLEVEVFQAVRAGPYERSAPDETRGAMQLFRRRGM